jgi:uncharacterized protein (TIGR02001 family)
MAKWRALIAGLVGAALSLSSALAAEEPKSLLPGSFSANVGLYTDYTFRGISQTQEKPAVQGGIDWSLDTGYQGVGVYLGAWGSNVDFNDGDEAQVEMDFYGGLTRTFGPVDAKIGFIYYAYPGAAGSLNYDFIEGTIGLSGEIMSGLTLGVSYNGTREYFGDSGDAHYFNAGLSYAVPMKGLDLTLFGNAGRQLIQKNDIWGTPDYWDWKIGATLAVTPNISISAFYTDTDISKADCTGGSENCDARGQLSLVAAF